MCGIVVPIDSLGDIFLAFSDDFCDSLFHSKCLSLCSDIVLYRCMILHWNGHFEAYLNFKRNQAIQSMLLVGLEGVDAFAIGDLYLNTAPFALRHFVLCDVFKRVKHRTTGRKVGMPILYYKANVMKFKHNVNNPDDPDNIYNYKDNQALISLCKPWERPNSTNSQQTVRFRKTTTLTFSNATFHTSRTSLSHLRK